MKKCRQYFGKCVAAGAAVMIPAMAQAQVVVPDLTMDTMESAAGKVFIAVAAIVAVVIGIRLFKKAA